MLCDNCNTSIENLPDFVFETVGIAIIHHDTWSSLLRSVARGCHLCSLIWGGANHNQLLEGHVDAGPIRLMMWHDTSHDSSTGDTRDELRMDVCIGKDLDRIASLSLVIAVADKTTAVMTEWADTPDSSTGSQANIAFMRHQLVTCNNQHRDCRPLIKHNPELPSRVIDVGAMESTICKIIDGRAKRGPYIALSHRWGANHFITTTANIHAHKQGIADYRLPKTYRDAVVLCRSFGIRYLWIDSLCILQDSQEDWAAEASRMTEVYGNCYLCIAACDAENDLDGCFFSRNALTNRPCVVEIQGQTFVVSRHLDEFAEVFSELQDHDGFLTKRAWVLQERVLPVRSLRFTKEQVFWECSSMTVSERHPIGLLGKLHNDMSYIKNLRRVIGGTIRVLPSTKETVYGWWYRTVMNYSFCDMTKSSDKLPAFSGLARAMAGRLEERYIAGLWQTDFARSLVWSAINNDHDRSRLPHPRAPSWSWASLKGAVSYANSVPSLDLPESTKVLLLTKIISVDVELAGNDPYGEVFGGSLVLTGRLLRTELEITSLDEGEVKYNGTSLGTFFRDEGTLSGRECYCIPVTASYRPTSNPVRRLFRPSIDPPGWKRDKVYCLVLKKLSSNNDFVRIGILLLEQAFHHYFDAWALVTLTIK